MFIRTMMLAVVVAMVAVSPGLIKQAQAAKTGAAKTGSFKYVSNSVRNIQRKLLNAGYLPGRVDGIFGPDTSRAITQYQKKHGLPQSGFPDARFLEQLNKNPTTKP